MLKLIWSVFTWEVGRTDIVSGIRGIGSVLARHLLVSVQAE